MHFTSLLGATVLLSVSSADARFGSQLSNRSIQWLNCSQNIPDPILGQMQQDPTFKLPSPLPSTLHCGRLQVPMDYSKAISKTNSIFIGFSMYRPKNPKGLLNFNPGGPGQEASSFAWSIALNDSRAAHFKGLEAYDFLAMDVRGTFSSNNLNCSIAQEIPSFIPSTQQEYDLYTSLGAKAAQFCIDNSTPKGIINHVRTEEVVQDWNSLRKALHYSKINLLGYSYGTSGGSLFATKFPQHVGNFALDGVAPLGVTNQQLISEQIKGVNRLIERADAACISDPTCPFHGQGKGSIPNAFKTALKMASNGSIANTSASDIQASTTLFYFGPSPDLPGFNNALFGAVNGNGTGFPWNDLIGPGFSAGAWPLLPLACSDYKIDNPSFTGFQALVKNAEQFDTYGVGYSQVLGLLALCEKWPIHGNFDKPLSIQNPMLLVTSDFDLNTPMANIPVQQQQSPNSAVVVRHGDDHGTFFVPGPARDAEIEFLNTGKFPKPTNEQLVTIYAPHSKIAAVQDPYNVTVGPDAGDGLVD